MTRLPTWVVPLVFAVVLFAGLLIPSRWGLVLLALATLFLVWLAALAWPTTSPRGRALRLLAIALVVVLAGSRVAGAG